MSTATFKNGDELRDILRGSLNAQPDTEPDARLVNGITRDVIRWQKTAADTNAIDVTANTTFGSVPQQAKVRNVWFTPTGALTANVTNFKRIIVRQYWANGTVRGELANIATVPTANGGTGDWIAKSRVTLASLTSNTVNAVLAGNLIVESGGAFEIQVTNTAAGVSVPAGTLELEYESY
jgi:hypothetical protein